MNALLTSKFDVHMKEELQKTICNSTIETMDQIFGYKITQNSKFNHYDSDIVVAHVEFWDVFDTFQTCFVFEKQLILSLVSNIYDPATLDKEGENEICMDTVSELANIISNKIKFFINKKGFNSIVEIPQAEMLSAIDPDDMAHMIQMNFCPAIGEAERNVIYIGLKDTN